MRQTHKHKMGIYQYICLLVFLIAPFIKSQEHLSFCEDYTKCMEELEVKQRECLMLDRNVKLKNNDDCGKKKWDKKLELNALHMRRAEVARDCVQKSMGDANLAESTLDASTHSSCLSLHQKFQFAKISSTSTPNRKKRSTSTKRNKRETKKLNNTNTKAQDCRNSAKVWHKQCAALANCCPLVEECKQSTQEIMAQIFEGRHKLRQMSETQCH
ncbi:unnamed protein product [Caenorhabditis angaria]|uniref:DUF19 domain-containing protein n=1 Tax=Caenorhabditis angaria TaxID=860376 RepID=A0A9P1MXK8_9PELO|nr:unnamed protein product [Caenorhabditis angaria]